MPTHARHLRVHKKLNRLALPCSMATAVFDFVLNCTVRDLQVSLTMLTTALVGILLLSMVFTAHVFSGFRQSCEEQAILQEISSQIQEAS